MDDNVINLYPFDMSEQVIKKSGIPSNILEAMKKAGAVVSAIEGEDLFSVTEIAYKDAAWDIYEKWACTMKNDPRVGAGCFPSERIINSCVSPPDNLYAGIQRETNSIINHYSTLVIENFEGNEPPMIGPPLPAPPMNTTIQHAKIALSALMDRIQNPPPDYPTLRSLKSGSYICTINQQWTNAGVEITLFKS